MLSLPEAMDPLIDYYKRFPDENPDWDDYRARMERERRVLIRIELERAGPDRSGCRPILIPQARGFGFTKLLR